MYTLENTMLKKTIIGLGLVTSLLLTSANAQTRAVDGGMLYETKNSMYTSYYVNEQKIDTTSFGRTPTKTELAAWNVDAMPDGEGLPKYDMKHGKVVLENGKPKLASGSVEWGNELYDAQCAMCHGDFGVGGVGGYPALAGGDIESLTNQLQNPADAVPGEEPPSRKIGSYWPYASTLFWYIQDAMPFPHPKSLSNSETYAISAYLLMENGVEINGEEMDEEYVMNKEKFMTIVMPNAEGFYPNVDTPKDPAQGVRNMTKYLSNPANYGEGKRCMSDCIKGKVPILRVKNELNDINPTPSTVRDLPAIKKTGAVHPGLAGYEASCSVCHATDMMGAPAVGDKDAWHTVMNKGLDTVYTNSINGINGMPPKGGTDLDDATMKVIVDYMIETSK